MAQLGRYSDVIRTLGSPELLERARQAKVLVVGSGGIGCELLKNLVLCGFENIETVCACRVCVRARPCRVLRVSCCSADRFGHH